MIDVAVEDGYLLDEDVGSPNLLHHKQASLPARAHSFCVAEARKRENRPGDRFSVLYNELKYVRSCPFRSKIVPNGNWPLRQARFASPMRRFGSLEAIVVTIAFRFRATKNGVFSYFSQSSLTFFNITLLEAIPMSFNQNT